MRDDDNDFTLRPGKIRHRGGGQPKSFFNEVMRSLRRQAGGKTSTGSMSGTISGGRSTFGRGRNAYGRSLFSGTSRRVAIKARIARHQGKVFRSAPMAKHMAYLKREGVTRDEGRAVMFDAEGDHANGKVFVDRYAEDRRHFRFIISPEDVPEME